MTLAQLFERENCSPEEMEAAYKYLIAFRLMQYSDELKRLLFILSKTIMR